MSFLDRFLGRTPTASATSVRRSPPSSTETDPDRVAVERYHYLLRTAPPEELERAHAEAFEQLTPEQRALVRADLEGVVPASEGPRSDEPRDLARVATRAELRQPGTLERAFGASRTPGMGGSFLQTFAAVFVATSAAQLLFGSVGDPYTDPAASDAGEDAPGAEEGPWGDEIDAGSADTGDLGADLGGDFGDFGGFEI
jgi:hypothetical protein